MSMSDKVEETAERTKHAAAEDKQHIQETAERARKSAREHGAAARERLAEHAPHRRGDGGA